MADQPNQQALALAEKIVSSIASNPEKADEYKQLLVGTFLDIYKIGQSTNSTPGVQAAPSVQATADKAVTQQEVKTLLQSKTFWGIALTAFATFAPKLGLHLGAFDTNSASDQMVQMATQIMQVGGLALSLYGRMKATQPVVLKK